MTYLSDPRQTGNKQVRLSFMAAIVAYILTSVHHFYGAIVYNTPWRKHVALDAGVALLACLLMLFLFRRYGNRIFLTLYSLVNLLVFGLGVGIFEGLYNHLLKNLLFFGGLNMTAFRALFPAPTYELPNNFVFESTGILQFPAGIMVIYYLSKALAVRKATA